VTLSGITRTRLEKAANDNGFDVEHGPVGEWLCFGSSHASITVWLTSWSDAMLIAAVSHPGVAAAWVGGVPIAGPLPLGAVAGRTVDDFAKLHPLLRRAWSLARSLPNALWQTWVAETADLPRTTEAERLVVQRVGQALYRQGLMELWDGRCAVTGLAVPALLRASHAKPWKDCERDEERLDVYNGLLLAAHLDAAFDVGLITVAVDGEVLVSGELDTVARGVLGLDAPRRVKRLGVGNQPYLGWHRERVFKA
jgi:putative restriction endonuclease